MENTSLQLRMMIYASLFAALISVGSYLSIPIGPVPIVLQNLFVFLAALLLGKKWGTASVAIFLVAGVVGLPVFAGGAGGIGRIFGPTGGYLLSYLPAAFLIGWVSERASKKYNDLTAGFIFTDILGLLLGSLLIYGIGVSWLKVSANLPVTTALKVGMYPFLIGDLLKLLSAVFISASLRPIIREHLSGQAIIND